MSRSSLSRRSLSRKSVRKGGGDNSRRVRRSRHVISRRLQDSAKTRGGGGYKLEETVLSNATMYYGKSATSNPFVFSKERIIISGADKDKKIQWWKCNRSDLKQVRDDEIEISMGYSNEQIEDAKAAGNTEIHAIIDYLALPNKTRPYKLEFLNGKSIEGTLRSRYDTISYVELVRQVEPNADGWTFAGSDVYYTNREDDPLTEESTIDMNKGDHLNLTIVLRPCLELTSITKDKIHYRYYATYVLTLQFSDDTFLDVECKESEWHGGKSTYSITGPKTNQSKMTEEQYTALQNYAPTTEFTAHKEGILDQLKPSA